MLFGISRARFLLYGAVVLALAGANVWRFQSARIAVATQLDESLPEPLEAYDGLQMADDFAGFERPARRDLFATVAPKPKTPPPKKVVKKEVPKVDPRRIALENAKKIFNAVKVLGILGARENPVAVIEYQNNIAALAKGAEVLPGFRIRDISLTHVTLRNDDLGVEEIFLVNSQ